MTRCVRAVAVVVAAASLATWGHLGTVALLRHLFGVFSWKWWMRDQVFLTSSGYLTVFALLSIVPLLVHVLRPRLLTLAHLVAFEATIAAFCILLLFQRLEPWALAILALAIGVQVYRRVADRQEHILRWSRRVAVMGVSASVVVSAAVYAQANVTERRAIRALVGLAPNTPSVLLIILDTVRARSMGLYGGPVDNSPRLAERSRFGVVFDNAYSTASWTLPSHASIFTGEYASQTGADWASPLDGRRRTLAEVFRDRGLATGGFVANTVAATYRTGLSRGFLHYEDTKHSPLEVLLSTTLTQTKSFVQAVITWQSSRWITGTVRDAFPLSLHPHGNYTWHDLIMANDVAEGFLDWQQALGGRPFFAFLNLFDAHHPYLPPVSARTKYGAEGLPFDRYLGAIHYMDDEVDRVLRVLEARGALRNTIVVITSDHGESFGEHGLNGHGNGLYRDQINVPLVILNAPGLPAGIRVRHPVSHRDLAATILDLAAVPRAESIGGVSLRDLITTGVAGQISPVVAEVSRGRNVDPRSYVGRADQKSIVDDSIHVIQSNLDTFLAFNLSADPDERDTSAVDSTVRQQKRAAMARVLQSQHITWRPPPKQP